MKILKRPVNLIYDTEKPYSFEYGSESSSADLVPLHHVTDQHDYEFLKGHFKETHPIFNDFGSSYFYVV